MHPRPSPLAILGIVALAAFTVFITWRAKRIELNLSHHDASSALTNKPAPPFALDALDGSKVSLAGYRGKKKLVVSFWASWCGPCRLELPVLSEFYKRHHKDSDNFEILAISIDDNREDAESYAAKAKLPFPVLLDLSHETADAFGVDGIPMLFVIDETGKVTSGHAGFDPGLEFRMARELGIKLKPGAERVADVRSSH
jgi:peroxiredoxin